MRWLDNMRLAKQLYSKDKNAHLGDIAVLKSDAVGVDVRPEQQALLDPVRGLEPDVDLVILSKLPSTSFGGALARFMTDNNLSPFRLTNALPDDVRQRNAFGIRYATTHDMFHVLLGFDTSWAGELGVLGFAVGQRYSAWQRLAAVLAWIGYPIMSGFRITSLWKAWRAGLRAGRRAPFLLGVRLEERFADDLNALREELQLPSAGAR